MVSNAVLFGLLSALVASANATPTNTHNHLDLSYARRDVPGVGITYNRMAVARNFPPASGIQTRDGCENGAWSCDGNKLTICNNGKPTQVADCDATGGTCSTSGYTGCLGTKGAAAGNDAAATDTKNQAAAPKPKTGKTGSTTGKTGTTTQSTSDATTADSSKDSSADSSNDNSTDSSNADSSTDASGSDDSSADPASTDSSSTGDSSTDGPSADTADADPTAADTPGPAATPKADSDADSTATDDAPADATTTPKASKDTAGGQGDDSQVEQDTTQGEQDQGAQDGGDQGATDGQDKTGTKPKSRKPQATTDGTKTKAPHHKTTGASAPHKTGTKGTTGTKPKPKNGGHKGNAGTGGGPKSYVQAPYNVVYSMLTDLPADPAELGPINVVNLAFWTSKSIDSQADKFLKRPDRQEVLDAYHKAGKVVILSLFGAEDDPTSKDPEAMAAEVSKLVKDNGLDGIDVDLEAGLKTGQPGGEWAIKFTNAARKELGPDYFITHAPQGPHFVKGQYAYPEINEQAGDAIDFYNIQYYNQGAENYVDCDDIVVKSKAFPGSALTELNAAGFPWEKLVLGKIMQKDDGGSGYMDPAALAKCVEQGKGAGWPGSVMFWQLHEVKQSADFYTQVTGGGN